MMTVRLREWPRLVAAGVALAVILVLVGVLVASAASGGGTRPVRVAAVSPAPANSAKVGQLRHQLSADQQTIASLRASLARTHAQLRRARHTARVDARRLRALKSQRHQP